MINKKNKYIFLLLFLPFLLYFINPVRFLGRTIINESSEIHFIPATILSIDKKIEKFNNSRSYPLVQKVKVKLLAGKFKHKEIIADNYIWNQEEYNFKLSNNQKILVKCFISDNEINYPLIEDYYRKNKVLGVLFISIILLIISTKLKGLKLLVSLGISFFVFFFLFIPYIREGYSIIFIGILFAVYIIIISFLIIMNYSLKSLNSIITTIVILFLIISAGYYSGTLLSIKCRMLPESIDILHLTKIPEDKIYLLFICGMFFSMLGAVMDVAGGLSSALNELTFHQKISSFKKVFTAGFNIGKDIIFTELGTILFAYISVFFLQFLIFYFLEIPFLLYINFEYILIYLLYPILCTVAIIFTIPVSIIIWIILLKTNIDKFKNTIVTSLVAVIFLISASTLLLCWDELPIMELKSHPLIEYKTSGYSYSLAKIVRITSRDNQLLHSTITTEQSVLNFKTKKILSNEFISATKFMWGSNKLDTVLKPDDWIVLEKDMEGNYYVKDKFRFLIIIYLILIILLLSIIFIGKKFIYLLIIILFSFGSIYYFIFPMIKSGYNPVIPTTVSILSLYIIVLGLIYRKSKNKEFYTGIITLTASIFISMILAYFFIHFFQITGMAEESIQELKYFSDRFNNGKFNQIQNLFIAIILLSIAGIILDITINLLSSIRELLNSKPDITYKELNKSILNIGYDIALTMSNTLVYIFIGTYLFNYLAFNVSITPLYPILNEQTIVFEIISVLITIFISIITVFLLSFVFKKIYFKER